MSSLTIVADQEWRENMVKLAGQEQLEDVLMVAG